MTANNHTFAVCAYGESPFLEECLQSLEAQTRRTDIILCTSTPNAYIEAAAKRHGLPLYVNPVRGGGIAVDWNFAYSRAATPYVTLAHQDDVYEPDYAARMLEGLERYPDTLIGFTAYCEIRQGRKVYAGQYLNLRMKKLLLTPLRFPALQKVRWVRRRCLSLGNPVGCPAVTYVKGKLPEKPFPGRFKCDLDWHTWETISRMKGRFFYIDQPLMAHRIHKGSTSAATIGADRGRRAEDLEMLKMFWPGPVARVINYFYCKSQRGNGAVKSNEQGK